MRVQVLYFARARELVGTDNECVQLEQSCSNTSELLHVLLDKHPSLESLTSSMVFAVNQVLVLFVLNQSQLHIITYFTCCRNT